MALSSRLRLARRPARATPTLLNPFNITPMLFGIPYLDLVWSNFCSGQKVRSGRRFASVSLPFAHPLWAFPLTGFSPSFAHPLLGVSLFFANPIVGFLLSFALRCCAVDCFVRVIGMALCSRLRSMRCSVRASSHRTTSSSTSGAASAPSSCRRPGGRAARQR